MVFVIIREPTKNPKFLNGENKISIEHIEIILTNYMSFALLPEEYAPFDP